MGARIGLVCRFKPVHLGHVVMLEALAERAGPDGELLVGLGSSNRHDVRNPFTAEESRDMIDLVLRPRFANYRFLLVPDLGHGPRWRALVSGLMGPLDLFVTANDYVAGLMGPVYRLAHPSALVPKDRRVPVDGTLVRRAMARGEGWRELVPPAVAGWLEARGVVARFRREFGLATLAAALEAVPDESLLPSLGLGGAVAAAARSARV